MHEIINNRTTSEKDWLRLKSDTANLYLRILNRIKLPLIYIICALGNYIVLDIIKISYFLHPQKNKADVIHFSYVNMGIFKTNISFLSLFEEQVIKTAGSCSF